MSSFSMHSLPNASQLKGWVYRRGTRESAFAAGKISVCNLLVPWMGPGGVSDIPGGDGVAPGVGWLRRTGAGAPIPSCLQGVWGFLAVPVWEGRQLYLWFWQVIVGCLSIAAFTALGPGSSTPRFFSSRTSARCFLNTYWVSSIPARENPPLAILGIFNARRMSDCSSCTRPPCLAIVSDMLKTYKKSVAASSYGIRQLPTPYSFQ